MQTSNNFVVIMAGGVGSRFWPASRSKRPKQFLDILGVGKSLIRLTFERFQQIVSSSNIFVVTHEDYQQQVLDELPELKENQVLCEPSRQNTAPCVAYAAFRIQQIAPEANFVVAPSDHLILKEAAFLEKIQQCLNFVSENEALLTLGISPTHPNTGYGYIHFDKAELKGGLHRVRQFTEKPDLTTAEQFLAGGEHLWNAGIFIWNVQTILKAYKTYAKGIYSAFEALAPQLGTAAEQQAIQQAYPGMEAISIDYAIMEQAQNIYTIAADIGWSDIGTWGALHKVLDGDEYDNTILHPNKQQVLIKASTDCLVRETQDKLVVINGLKDYIIVDEEDVLLIYPKNKEQEIKAVRKEIEDGLKKFT